MSSPSRAERRSASNRPSSSACGRRARSSTAAADSDEPIYGLTSALGANTGKPLAPDERTRFQVDAVRARAVGVGPAMDEERVRAIMFVRAAGMAQGGSGVSLPVFRALVDALNQRIYPAVPAWGTISVSDLPPLSHIALVLIGEGRGLRRRPARSRTRRARARGARAGRARPQGRPRAGERERCDRRQRVSRARRSCAAARSARRHRRAVVRGLSRESVAACGAGAGRSPGAGAGRGGAAACAARLRAARSRMPAPRAASRIRCRFAASRKCMAPRRTRSRTPSSTSRSSSTRPPTARASTSKRARSHRTATSTSPASRSPMRRSASASRRSRRSSSSAA